MAWKMQSKHRTLLLSCLWTASVLSACIPTGHAAPLPNGGPNEAVPPAQVKRNVATVRSFFATSATLAFRNAYFSVLIGAIPTLDTSIPEWAPDIQGQILPLGKYGTAESSAAYWFLFPALSLFRGSYAYGLNALASTPDNPQFLTIAGTRMLRIFGSGNMVFYERNLKVNQTTPDGRQVEAYFTQFGTFYLNRDSKICGYDVEARYLNSFYSELGSPFTAKGFPAASLMAQVPVNHPSRLNYLPNPGVTTWVEEICDVAMSAACASVGELQYGSKEECMQLLSLKRRGSYDGSDHDTQLCRAVHRLLVPTDPKVHCPHLSHNRTEEQGGVCIDRRSSVYIKRNFQCGYDDVGYAEADFEAFVLA